MSRRLSMPSVVTAALLAGCAPTYGEFAGWRHTGYHSIELEPGRFHLEYQANALLSQETVSEYWDRRASELCKGNEFEVISKEVKNTNPLWPAPRHPTIEGEIRCRD